MGFPRGFVWGAATSAYQIEGGTDPDTGRGLSVWDEFCRRPGAVWNGHTGDVACDHHNRYRADVGLMREIGLQAYRFSISWPRVLPEGKGPSVGAPLNTAGLDFYDRLVDELVAAKIAPYVTLFHWDLPLALQQRGGWLNRDVAAWFAEYAAVVTDRLSDRVRHWMTMNEPQVHFQEGHVIGTHAPGLKLPLDLALLAGHNHLRAHGKAVQAIRTHAKSDCQIGYAPVGVVGIPETDSPADRVAAEQYVGAVNPRHLFNNAWWIDPVVFGAYPEAGLEAYGDAAPIVEPGDMEDIHQPLDYLGLNIYFGQDVHADGNGGFEEVPFSPTRVVTPIGFKVSPAALYWGPKLLGERYKLPIYITENGTSVREWVYRDGKVHDSLRIDFLHRYLRELLRAADDGVDLRGYFHWSLLDNFEWAAGYRERFGLIHVDYDTQQRTPKDSAAWYREVIASNGETLVESP